MQSFTSIGRALYRIVFRRGSPQRIHYSQRLTIWTLLALVMLAAASQLYVIGNGAVEIILYLFTLLSGMYLAVAWSSRSVPRGRLRQGLQAALLILAAAHLALLAAAPLIPLVDPLAYLMGALVGTVALMGLTNCVQFALGSSRARAAGYTLIFAFALTAFYATMLALLEIALV